MKLRTIFAALAILTLTAGAAFAATKFTVTSGEFDPGNTFLVQAQWLNGIGCPSGTTYNDPACNGGQANDSSDKHNQGLLLAKTGPTATNASAFAVISGVKGPVTELGYDIRKPVSAATDMGSHCGAGAPRFNVETTTAFYFIGCNSPPATQTATGNGWIRLRWGGPLIGFNTTTQTFTTVTGDVKSLSIVFDEGQDTGPDFFGLAVIDNVDVNGTLVGQGDNAGKKDKNKDKDKDKDKDKNGDDDDQGEDD